MYSSEYAGVLGKVHHSNQASFNAEETELCFPQEGSGKWEVSHVGKKTYVLFSSTWSKFKLIIPV